MKLPINKYPSLISMPVYLYLKFYARTSRLLVIGEDHRETIRQSLSPVILSTWHSRLAIPIHHISVIKMTVLVSQSRDGEFITRAVQKFGMDVCRGSASRGGTEGLMALLRRMRRGCNAAITPDGPRGPKEEAQMGIITLAKLTGAPIVPLSSSCSRMIRLNSWDRFAVPFPFSTIYLKFGEFITVPRDADEAAMEEHRLRLQNELNRITREMDEKAGNAG